MSGTMSKPITEDDDVRCYFPGTVHCPVKCISRSYAHIYMRFQHMEKSVGEIKNTLDTVVDYIAREKSSSSSNQDSGRNKKKPKKSGNGSGSGSQERNIDEELLVTQAILEKDFTQLLTWKDSDDEGGRPKRPKRCQVISCLKSDSSSSNDGNTSEQETSEDDQRAIAEADEIVRKVSKVIDDMAKVVDEIQVTAGIAVQIVRAADEEDEDKTESENDVEVEDVEVEDEEDSEPEFVGDFLALYNEMNEVD